MVTLVRQLTFTIYRRSSGNDQLVSQIYVCRENTHSSRGSVAGARTFSSLADNVYAALELAKAVRFSRPSAASESDSISTTLNAAFLAPPRLARQ
jgi:hypothetical protein